MTLYAYRCDADGPVDLHHPMGSAPDLGECPACGAAVRRVITAPRLGLADRGRLALLDRTAASASAPEVVGSPPPRPGARRAPALHPATRSLPRPTGGHGHG